MFNLSIITSLTGDSRNFIAVTKGFKRPQVQILPIHNQAAVWSTPEHEKAQLFGEQQNIIFKPHNEVMVKPLSTSSLHLLNYSTNMGT